MRITTAGIAVVLATVALALPASAAQGRGRGQGAKPQKAEQKQEKRQDKAEKKANKDGDVAVFDRDGHVRAVREYARSGSLPPGLAKREALPPGLRRQLRERGTLPPGLQRRLIDVPQPLTSRLPRLPDGQRRYFAGDDLLVVDTRTNRIVAFVPDVWR